MDSIPGVAEIVVAVVEQWLLGGDGLPAAVVEGGRDPGGVVAGGEEPVGAERDEIAETAGVEVARVGSGGAGAAAWDAANGAQATAARSTRMSGRKVRGRIELTISQSRCDRLVLLGSYF
ncbi:MAG: hypothetical protein ABSD44_00680 [Terracidiphilus sp.]